MLHVKYGYTGLKRDQLDSPSALVLPIASLDNLVFTRKNLLLQYLRSSAFVDSGYLQDLRCVDIGVGASPHDSYAADHALVDLYASVADN